jgi:hypothetical protein
LQLVVRCEVDAAMPGTAAGGADGGASGPQLVCIKALNEHDMRAQVRLGMHVTGAIPEDARVDCYVRLVAKKNMLLVHVVLCVLLLCALLWQADSQDQH